MGLKDYAWQWNREHGGFELGEDSLSIVTKPKTDLWQRTYYGFQNDNAPALQARFKENRFIFTVKTSFKYNARFDQCGLIMYVDSDNWLKISCEYENAQVQHLGSVATNRGYSDWGPREISADIKEIWYRVARNGQDFVIQHSYDGTNYHLMRVCHMDCAVGEIPFGFYAASPEDSSFKATFSEFDFTDGTNIAMPEEGECPQ